MICKYYKTIKTPFGINILVAEENEVLSLCAFDCDLTARNKINSFKEFPSPLLHETELQLRAYFNGELKEFNLPLKESQKEFQKKVWTILKKIPYGKVTTYKKVAEECGSPKFARGVGAICRINPFTIIIPCHRVIASNGSLGGYAGGIKIKKLLMTHEGIVLDHL